MNNLLDKYFTSKRKELCDYASYLMTIFSYKEFDNNDNRKNDIKKSFDIYFNLYYKARIVNLDEGNKIFTDNTASIDSKCLLSSLMIHLGNKYKTDDEYVNYCSAIMYLSFMIFSNREKFTSIVYLTLVLTNTIKMISDKFTFDESKSKKKLQKLIVLIKTNIKKDNKLKNVIININNKDSYNDYTLLIEKCNLYKSNYHSNIKGLEGYKKKTIKKVFDKENIEISYLTMSFDLITLTLLKALLNNKDVYIAIPLTKDFYSKKKNVNLLLKMVNSKYLKEHIKVYIKDDEYEDNDGLKQIINHGLKIIVESDKFTFVNEIKLDNMILLINQDFSTKYREDLDKLKIKYFLKSEEKIFDDKHLINPVVFEMKEE